MTHRSPITCVDHHMATELTVTGGYDGRVIAWNADGTERWAADFDDLVNDVRVDPSGTRVAVAVADRFAFVLDVRDGARVEVFGPHGDDVNAVRWSPDGNRLACVMDHLDTTIRVWERTGVAWHQRTLVGHDSGVFAVAFDPSGTRLATVAEDSTGRVWDVLTGAQLHVLVHPGDPEALDWSPDGSWVVTGCDDGVARVWNPDTGELVRELTDADAAVRFIRFDDTGARVLVGSYDATMRVYDCATWAVTDSLTRAFQWERSGSFTRGGVILGSFGAQPVEHPERVARPLPLTVGINAIAVAHGRLLVGRDDGGVIDVLRAGVVTRHDTIVNTIAISPDGSRVASGDYRGGIRVTPLDSASVAASVAASGSASDAAAIASVGVAVSTRAADGGPINSIVWHPSGTHFFSGGYDGCVRVWHPDGTCTETFTAHHGPIKSLGWSKSANLLVAGSSDGSLSGWRDGVEQWRSRTEDLVLVNAVACADGSGHVVSASRDLRVRVWDAATGSLLETLGAGHLKSVKAIAVSHDGSTILTGSYDGTAIVWQRREGGWAWRPLRLHGKPGVPAVSIADGNLFTAGWNATVGRWNLDGRLAAEYRADLIRA
jgi:WD40 repeat protein